MSNFYPLFAPLAPLITGFLTLFSGSKDGNYKLGKWLMLAGFLTSLSLLWQLIQNPEPINFVLFNSSSEIIPSIKLVIDRLAAVMMVVISGFGALLFHYSSRYLQQDSGQSRFQILLTLLVSSLMFMVASSDFITLFICWQLLTWFFCLLFHNFSHLLTAQSSFRTFIMLRFGDLAFLAAIVLAYKLYGTLQFAEVFEKAALDQSRFAVLGTGFEITGTSLVTLLIFIAVMFKSAQFPLHIWLVDSLYAPTPVSAILHAGVINAGGFLMTRLAPLFVLSSLTLHLVLLVGFVTLILGKSVMLVQNDVKKTLVYSTIGQMGYMVMECGVGAFPLAVFHLIAHGLFKAYLFLNCGDGIHQARLTPKSPPRENESTLTFGVWILAFIFSFLLPLGLMAWVHEVLNIHFLNFQGLFILFLFSWVVAAQAMLTMFRLQRTLIAKGAMLVTISSVAIIYFLGAEAFTRFLIPDHHIVEAYFKAAELPVDLFIALALVLVLAIFATWIFAFHRHHNDERKSWFDWIKVKLYLIFINRFYLDGFGMRLFYAVRNHVRKLNGSLLYYALTLYAMLAWYVFEVGQITVQAISYAWSATFVLFGLLFALARLRARYGDFDLRKLGGLHQPMPRFALCFSLLTMAALSLPPFSLFFTYLEILFSPSVSILFITMTLLVIFVSCSYLFKLMKELLFGPCREDLYYQDLNLFEMGVFVLIIILTLIPPTCLIGVIQ